MYARRWFYQSKLSANPQHTIQYSTVYSDFLLFYKMYTFYMYKCTLYNVTWKYSVSLPFFYISLNEFSSFFFSRMAWMLMVCGWTIEMDIVRYYIYSMNIIHMFRATKIQCRCIFILDFYVHFVKWTQRMRFKPKCNALSAKKKIVHTYRMPYVIHMYRTFTLNIFFVLVEKKFC